MLWAVAITSSARAPATAPPNSQGRRIPKRDVVRSLSLPKIGFDARARNAPIPSTSERPRAGVRGSTCCTFMASETTTGVKSAVHRPKYASA